MKKAHWIILTVGLLIIFGFIAVLVFLTNNQSELSKLNLIIQLVYTFVTTVLVILTLGVLRETQNQKHMNVRPYLTVYGMDFWNSDEKNIKYDLCFYVTNEGNGIALNVSLKLINRNNDECIFKREYTRLSPPPDRKYEALVKINDTLNNMDKQSSQGSTIFDESDLEVEVPLHGERSDFLNISAVLEYEDIYKKRYRNTFAITLQDNDDNDEGYECVESFEELL